MEKNAFPHSFPDFPWDIIFYIKPLKLPRYRRFVMLCLPFDVKTSLRRGGRRRKGRKEITEDWSKCWWRVRDGKRMMKWKSK